MSDATLPLPPRSSSVAPVSEGRPRADSSSGEGEGEFDTSIEQATASLAGEDLNGESGGRAENKQKRKRTRYIRGVFISTGTSNVKLSLV